jgi:hypothetical protein
MEAHEELESIN